MGGFNKYPPQNGVFQERDDIGDEYHNAVLAATEMRMWIHSHIGPGQEFFFSFYRPFCNLFELTCDNEEVKGRLDKDDLRKKIQEWFDETPKLNDAKLLTTQMKAGLALFRSYKKILSDSQILKDKR